MNIKSIQNSFATISTGVNRTTAQEDQEQNAANSLQQGDTLTLSAEAKEAASGLQAVFSPETETASASASGGRASARTNVTTTAGKVEGDTSDVSTKVTETIEQQIEDMEQQIEDLEEEIRKLQQEPQSEERDKKIQQKQSSISVLRAQVQQLNEELSEAQGSSATGGTETSSASDIASAQVAAS